MRASFLHETTGARRRRCGRLFPALAAATALLWAGMADGADPLGLDQLIARALSRNPRMGMARAEVDAAQARLNQQLAARYPSLAVEGRLERATLNSATPMEANPYLDLTSLGLGQIPIRNADSDMSGFDRASAGLSAEYLLLDFGRRSASEEAADQSLTAVRADLEDSANATVLEVSQTYFELLRELALTEVERDSRSRKREALRMSRLLHETGRSAAGDVARAEADLARAEVELTRSGKRVELARLALRHALGEPPDAPPLALRQDSRLPDPKALADNVELLLQQALDQRPELASRRAAVAAAGATVKNRRADELPSLSLLASLTEQAYLDGESATNYSVGIKLGWTLFDGGLRRGRRDEAQAQLIRDRERLREQILSVVTSVRDARQSYLEAKRRLQLTREVVDSSTLDLKLARAGYREGVRSFYDLSLAESGYRDASAQRVAAEYDLQSAIARFYWALGTLRGIPHT